MEISEKIHQLEAKIQRSEERIEREQKKIEEYRKEVASLRYLRYDNVCKELNLSDDELIAFVRQMKQPAVKPF